MALKKIPIDEAPAGPEMDAAVAEALDLEVMGITLCAPDPECSGYYLPYSGRGGVELRPVYLTKCVCDLRETDDVDYFGHTAGCLETVSEYSTDIAAAWSVFEQLKHTGATLGWGREWLVPYVALPMPEWVHVGDRTCYGAVYADSMPLAICRAFLKANGIEYIEVPE